MSLVRLLLALVVFSATSYAADDRVHIWIRAFIPKELEGNSTYMKPIPGRAGQFMISSPSLFRSKKFFSTDHRSFSAAIDASSRLMTEFVLVAGPAGPKVEKVDGRPIHRTSPTERLIVNGQQVDSEKKTAALSIDAIGNPMAANGMVQIAGQAAAANPFLLSPWVDYSFDLIFKPASKELIVKVNVGAFPAFEGYASLNGGNPVTLFKGSTTIDHAAGLFDFGTGLTGRRIEETVKF